MATSAPQTTVHNHSSELLEHLMAEEISLQVQKIAEGLQREGWPMALVKRFMHVAVEDLPEWSLSKAPLTIQGLQSLKALQVFWLVMGSEGSSPRHLSFDLSGPHSDSDHSSKLREVSKFFFCSSTYSSHPEDVQGLMNESNFSLPGLRPVHRKVFSDL